MRISDGMKHPLLKERFGYSLVEVMIAMALFGIMATGFMASCLFARKAAESAACENAALCVAQGYMEQIKSNTYATLAAVIACASRKMRTRCSAACALWSCRSLTATRRSSSSS